MAAMALIAAPAQAAAQQGYTPQYNTAQPQYSGPQYAQPQYQQPQYQQSQPYANQPYAAPASPYEQPDPGQQAAAPVQALSAQDLEQLLAPIALYPDSLLAQILTAATYPAQVAVADQWLQQMRAQGCGSPEQIAAGANAQTSWDPSIKALTAFPDVLDMLDRNLEWTTALGNAYYNQPQDVMQTVQVLRDRAEQAGNLESTPQEEVTENQGYIELAPTDPQVVYVPTYNPWAVYGVPIAAYPGFAFAGPLDAFYDAAAPIEYGLGFALSAFDRFPFGWTSWGFDWMDQAVMFGQSSYFTRSASVADWGLPRGGPRAYNGWGGGGRWRDGAGQSWGDRSRGDQRAFNRGDDGRRGGWGDSRGPGQSFSRPANGFPEPGRLNNRDSFNRGFQENRGFQDNRGAQSYARPAPQQNNGYRSQTPFNGGQGFARPGYSSRPQTFYNPRSNYGYNYRPANPNPGQAFATRPGFSYANPYSNNRAPQSNARTFAPRSNGGYNNFTAPSNRGGGFHLFGRSQAPSGFSGGGRGNWGGSRAPSFSGGGRAPSFSSGGGHAPSFSGGGGGHWGGFSGGHQSAPRNFGGGGGGHASAPSRSHSSGGGGGRRR
ncbi:MAG: DUF3300 domain-containing protein [Terracidiphilus sp.]|jgi:hypothetical protein